MEDLRVEEVVPTTEAYVVKPLHEAGDIRLYSSFLAAKQDYGWDVRDHIQSLANNQVWKVDLAPLWSEKDYRTQYAIQKVIMFGERDISSDEALEELRRKLYSS